MIRTIMAIIGTAVGIAGVGIPILFALVGAAVAPSRGREKMSGYVWGVWLGPFYLIYLAFQPSVTSTPDVADVPAAGPVRQE